MKNGNRVSRSITSRTEKRQPVSTRQRQHTAAATAIVPEPPRAFERGWEEVAMIDFTGYVDRDCEERIIYKTPKGELKAAKHLAGGEEVIEDVTREQVTRWLTECVIPQEFERDFASALNGNSKAPRRYQDLLISQYRAEKLQELSDTLGVAAKQLWPQALSDYLLFVETYPHWAQAQPQFVHATAALAIFPTGPLHDRMDHVCGIYRLDKNSVVDAALRVLEKFVRHHSNNGMKVDVEFTSDAPGIFEPENALCILTKAASPEQCTFAKIANQLCNQEFEAACGDLDAFRSLIQYHPGFEAEREALEMISEGANRLWASPAQARWREARAVK